MGPRYSAERAVKGPFSSSRHNGVSSPCDFAFWPGRDLEHDTDTVAAAEFRVSQLIVVTLVHFLVSGSSNHIWGFGKDIGAQPWSLAGFFK
jgi:hypothetical protein